MSLADSLSEGPPQPPTLPSPNKGKHHPSGWEPHVEETAGKASVITQPTTGNPDHAELLAASDLSPEEWHIVGDIQVRRWQQTEDGPWLRYFKFNARSGRPQQDPEFEAACKHLLRHKPKKPARTKAKTARIFCLSDTQIGKGEGGGSPALARRVEAFIDDAVAICKAEKPQRVILAGLGDLVEKCAGHYPSQAFTTDLNERQQERFARRMILACVKALAPLTPELLIVSVGGNHGENRGAAGKAFTDPGDNADVAVFEQVYDALADAPAFKHVRWMLPEQDLTATFDVYGTIVSLVHGHQFGGGANPLAKAIGWWKGQSLGSQGPGDADLLISGHYHHLNAVNTHGRMWLQCPSADGGSQWHTSKTGEWSQPGFLTVAIDDNGVRDFTVLWSPE